MLPPAAAGAWAAGEHQPRGPSWDWLLDRPEERWYNHWSREPLREVDKPMWYTMEKHKPPGHEVMMPQDFKPRPKTETLKALSLHYPRFQFTCRQ